MTQIIKRCNYVFQSMLVIKNIIKMISKDMRLLFCIIFSDF
jgi:hypothetical protein